VRTLNAHQRSQAAKFGVEILGADRWRDVLPLIARFRGALYLSIDLDVLEPMLAPGVSHPEPGGLTIRDVLEILSAIRVPVVGADIVEYNPANDVRDLTAMGFPVWSKAVCAQGTVKETLGSVNVPVVCAGAAIEAGDVVVADDDGVCIVRRGDAERVLKLCAEREAKEAKVRARLKAGELGLDFYGLRTKLTELGVRWIDSAE